MGYEPLTLEGWKYLGSGGEASAYKGAINLKDATNGAVHYDGKVDIVFRAGGDPEHAFLNNLAAALLDAAFVSGGKYAHRHIPQPLGLAEAIGLKDGYLYEYVEGSGGFPWEFDRNSVTLEEWIDFCNAFNATGVGIQHDITDPDNARVSQNIILHSYEISDLIKGILPLNWARIDFGSGSCTVSWEKFGAYLKEREDEIKHRIGSMKDVLILAYQAGTRQLDFRRVVDRYYEELHKSDISFFTRFVPQDL